jgi:hypothetical protein
LRELRMYRDKVRASFADAEPGSTGSGSRVPLRISRSWPFFSATRRDPSGRNAMLNG